MSVHLGMMSWSFFRSFASGDMTLDRMIELASELGVGGVEIAPDHIQDWGERFLTSLGERIRERGLYVDLDDSTGLCHSGEASDSHAEHVDGMLLAANRLGAENLREIVGVERFAKGPALEDQLRVVVEHLRRLEPLCAEHGVSLCVENHGDITAPDLARVLAEVNNEWVRCCLDTGNLIFTGDDDVEGTRLLAPFARMSHYSDTHIKGRPWGLIMQAGPFGGGVCNLPEITKMLIESSPGVHLNLEVATPEGDEVGQITDAVALAREIIGRPS